MGHFLACCIEVNMNKILMKILQGSVATQSMLGGLTNYISFS